MRVIDRCHHQHIKFLLLEHLLKILLWTESQIIPSLFFQHIRNYKISNLQQHISWLRACRLLEASCYANPFVHRWYHKALPDWCLHDWPLLSCRAFHFLSFWSLWWRGKGVTASRLTLARWPVPTMPTLPESLPVP